MARKKTNTEDPRPAEVKADFENTRLYDAVTCLIVVAFIVIATAPAWLLAISVTP
jgi:hypothetical protein